MDTAGSEAHEDALAVTVKGEVTWAPFSGAFTVIAEVAVAADDAALAIVVGMLHAVSTTAAKGRSLMKNSLEEWVLARGSLGTAACPMGENSLLSMTAVPRFAPHPAWRSLRLCSSPRRPEWKMMFKFSNSCGRTRAAPCARPFA